MKRIVSTSESKLKEMIKTIVEDSSQNFIEPSFEDVDYIEVFYKFFRPWVKENHGEEISEYPMSYLAERYLKDFMDYYEMTGKYYAWSSSMRNMVNAGKWLVDKGKHQLKTLRPKNKFTEKNKRALDIFLQNLDLPDYMKLVITENIPYEVNAKLIVNFEKLLRAEKNLGSSASITDKLMEDLKNYLGLEFGSPLHGKLNFTVSRPEFVGIDEWVKNELNKVIKKKIKSLPNSSSISRIMFKPETTWKMGGGLKIIFKYGNWNNRVIMKGEIEKLLRSLGYNTDILKIEGNY